MAFFNKNHYANQRHSGCSFTLEETLEAEEEGNVESASKTKETEIRAIGEAVLGVIIGGIFPDMFAG